MENKEQVSDYSDAQIDEHDVCLKVIEIHKEWTEKREKYKKYGPLFIVISGVVFLTLMFSLESKIEFLILWVISIITCMSLMIRAEYKYHQYSKILGLINEDEEYDDEENEYDDEKSGEL